MTDYEYFSFSGTLAKDAEIATTANGGKMTKYQIQFGKTYQKNGETISFKTSRFVTFFGDLFLEAGTRVICSGTISDSKSNDGTKYYTNFNAKTVIPFLDAEQVYGKQDNLEASLTGFNNKADNDNVPF